MRQDQQTYYAAKARRNRHWYGWWLFGKSLPFVLVGALIFAQYLFPKPSEAILPLGSAQDRSGETYYRNCAAAWAAGVAPITSGDPGYRGELDGDGDGIACEPFRRRQ